MYLNWRSRVSCFLILSPLENSFPSAELDIRRGDVPDPFVVAAVVVELDERHDGRLQSLRAGGHQQIQPRFERLVEPVPLAVGY